MEWEEGNLDRSPRRAEDTDDDGECCAELHRSPVGILQRFSAARVSVQRLRASRHVLRGHAGRLFGTCS